MKKYQVLFRLQGTSCAVLKDVQAENKTEAFNIMKEYIKNTLPERLEEYTKTNVSIKED